jgi:hypothetical protein
VDIAILDMEGLVDLDPKIVGQTPSQGPPGVALPPQPKKVKAALNSNDPVFKELRSLSFTAVGASLRRKALMLQEIEQVSLKFHF